VAIGVSTGGPEALAKVLPALPANFPVPVVIAQHMPPIFTSLLASRLSAKSSLPVRECRAGEPLVPGCVWIAPGDYHMVVNDESGVVRLRVHQGPGENFCRPSVDVLFRSVAHIYMVLGPWLSFLLAWGRTASKAARNWWPQVRA
jgi:two-component system, chemotaxis family, protein-glutamate methylesterase/glutaminase